MQQLLIMVTAFDALSGQRQRSCLNQQREHRSIYRAYNVLIVQSNVATANKRHYNNQHWAGYTDANNHARYRMQHVRLLNNRRGVHNTVTATPSWSSFNCMPLSSVRLLYPTGERSESGGYTVFTFVSVCVCAQSVQSSTVCVPPTTHQPSPSCNPCPSPTRVHPWASPSLADICTLCMSDF